MREGRKTLAQPNNVILTWPISCFDRRKPNPLPVETKWYILDEDRASDSEKAAILSLIERGNPAPPAHSNTTDEPVVTLSHDFRRPGREVLRYRSLFRECSPADIDALFREHEKRAEPFALESVSLIGEYFEDETGKEVTTVEMCDHMAGGGPTVIIGHPESVTRLGPAGPKDQDNWSVETANTIAHFFQVLEHIRRSAWFRSPLSLTSVAGKYIVAEFPSAEAAFGMLVLIRQLCSSDSNDDLFNRACGHYLRHVDHPAKAMWVKAEKSSFNQMLKRRPIPLFQEVDCSFGELLVYFWYGARLVHSRPDDPSETQRLRDALSKTPRERLVMAFHSGMKLLLNSAFTVYPVIRQDFLHWTENLSLAGADIIDIADLFSSRAEAD